MKEIDRHIDCNVLGCTPVFESTVLNEKKDIPKVRPDSPNEAV
jgi:hypothetical protein